MSHNNILIEVTFAENSKLQVEIASSEVSKHQALMMALSHGKTEELVTQQEASVYMIEDYERAYPILTSLGADLPLPEEVRHHLEGAVTPRW